MKLETPLIALVVASLIFTSLFTVFVTQLGTDYGADMDMGEFATSGSTQSLQESFDKINETKAEMDNLNAQYSEQEVTDSGSLFGFVKMSKDIGEQMLGSVTILKKLLYAASGVLGIPPIFITSAIAVILTIIIIEIVMILAGRSY